MSELLKQLFANGTIWLGVFETLYMTEISTAIAYVIGLPLGIVLFITDKNGIKQNLILNKILGIIVNIFRSMPFIILMVAMLPVAKFLIGTSLGNGAMIVMLVIAAAPYVARMVESSLKEVDTGVIEAARSMGAGTFKIVVKVLLPEAKPSLLVGAVISTVTIIGYSAMAGTIGGTGLGKTHLTTAIAKGIIEKGYNVVYESAQNIVHAFESRQFGKDAGEAADTDKFFNCDLLIIDDLGTEFRSSFTQSVLYNLINTRINSAKCMIISTNLDSTDKFIKTYDERIASRLFGSFRTFAFVGKDIRVQKVQQSGK